MYRKTGNAKCSLDTQMKKETERRDRKEKHVNLLWVHLQDSRDDNVSHFGSRICPGSWVSNWVNITVKSTFAIGKYMINKSEFFFKKKLTLFIFISSCLYYFHSYERLQLHMIDCRRINDYPITERWRTNGWVLTIQL